jgi:hypothetical protein
VIWQSSIKRSHHFFGLIKKRRQQRRFTILSLKIHLLTLQLKGTVDFTLDGQHFTALNGGPVFKFNESVSFVVHCKNQEEIDYYRDSLLKDGGKEFQCGWLKDKFGLSWQVVPDRLLELLNVPTKKKPTGLCRQ